MKWHKYPEEKPTHIGDYLIRGNGGVDDKPHYWLCLWVEGIEGLATDFYYNGNEFRCTNRKEFEWMDIKELEEL